MSSHCNHLLAGSHRRSRRSLPRLEGWRAGRSYSLFPKRFVSPSRDCQRIRVGLGLADWWLPWSFVPADDLQSFHPMPCARRGSSRITRYASAQLPGGNPWIESERRTWRRTSLILRRRMPWRSSNQACIRNRIAWSRKPFQYRLYCTTYCVTQNSLITVGAARKFSNPPGHPANNLQLGFSSRARSELSSTSDA